MTVEAEPFTCRSLHFPVMVKNDLQGFNLHLNVRGYFLRLKRLKLNL